MPLLTIYNITVLTMRNTVHFITDGGLPPPEPTEYIRESTATQAPSLDHSGNQNKSTVGRASDQVKLATMVIMVRLFLSRSLPRDFH